jgi:PDZ domain-containing protein
MTTSDATLSPPSTRPARRPRWHWVVLGVVLVLAVAAVVADHVDLAYYAEVPGVAQPVTALVTVPAAQDHPLHGSLLLTDVGVEPVTALSYLFDLFGTATTLVPTGDLTGGLPTAEFDAEGTVEMQEAQATAEAVALRQLGYAVPEKDVGVTLFAIIPGTPAYRSLQVGDVVTSVDGTPTTNPAALVAAIEQHRPGEVVDLQVGTVAHPTDTHQVQVTLGSQRLGGTVHPILGIPYSQGRDADGMGTQAVYSMPVPVTLRSDGIGGPSAGLAFTLGILDHLAGGDLTGGRIVAATGTMDPDGSVGEIGGLPQKTVAVERAHASVFLVPAAQVAQAKALSKPGLTVLGVKDLQQALQDLQRLGGHLGAAATGPPAGPAGHQVPAQWQSSPWS